MRDYRFHRLKGALGEYANSGAARIDAEAALAELIADNARLETLGETLSALPRTGDTVRVRGDNQDAVVVATVGSEARIVRGGVTSVWHMGNLDIVSRCQ